jgi:hypothetical protein
MNRPPLPSDKWASFSTNCPQHIVLQSLQIPDGCTGGSDPVEPASHSAARDSWTPGVAEEDIQYDIPADHIPHAVSSPDAHSSDVAPFSLEATCVQHSVQRSAQQLLVIEWSEFLASDHPCVIPLEVRADAVVWLVPAYDCTSGSQLSLPPRESCPLAFTTIQNMFFSGEVQMVSICSNPGCDRTEAASCMFKVEAQQPHRGATYTEVFQDIEPLCRCALALVQTVVGADVAMEDAVQLYTAWFEDEQMHSTPSNQAACHHVREHAV